MSHVLYNALYAIRWYTMSYRDRLVLSEYYSKIAQQHDIADKISFIIAGHLILADRADLLHADHTICLANAAICTLYLLNNLTDYGRVEEIFKYIGDDRFETYTVPGYDPFILYRDDINYALISHAVLPTGDISHCGTPRRPPHVFDPPQWYTTHEIIHLATATQEVIEREIATLINGLRYKKQIMQIAHQVWQASHSRGNPSRSMLRLNPAKPPPVDIWG